MTGDGSINFFDVSAVTGTLYPNQDPIADFNFDGTVNFFDISAVTSAVSAKTSVGVGWLSDDGASGPRNRLGFMGYQWEPEVGLWLGRNRMYSPEAGRWLQRDPAGYVDGLSMYLFTRGNPLSYIDSMGLCATDSSAASWHHLLPKSLLEKFRAAGITEKMLHSAEYGVIMNWGDHQALHGKWNKIWENWFGDLEGKKITKGMVNSQLSRMMGDERFSSHLAKGFSAVASGVSSYGYGRKKTSNLVRGWNHLDKSGKSKAATKALEVTDDNRARLVSAVMNAKKTGNMARLGRVAKGVTKKLGPLGLALTVIAISSEVAEGKTLGASTWDNASLLALLVDSEDMKLYKDAGNSWIDGIKDSVQRKKKHGYTPQD